MENEEMKKFLVHFKYAGHDGRALMLNKENPTFKTIETWEQMLNERHSASYPVMVVSFTPLG